MDSCSSTHAGMDNRINIVQALLPQRPPAPETSQALRQGGSRLSLWGRRLDGVYRSGEMPGVGREMVA